MNLQRSIVFTSGYDSIVNCLLSVRLQTGLFSVQCYGVYETLQRHLDDPKVENYFWLLT